MANFFAALKSIYSILSLVKDLVEWFRDHKVRQAEKQIKIKKDAKDRLTVKIEEEAKKEKPDDETIKDLHRRIVNLGL
jgi:hypothetical protein